MMKRERVSQEEKNEERDSSSLKEAKPLPSPKVFEWSGLVSQEKLRGWQGQIEAVSESEAAAVAAAGALINGCQPLSQGTSE